MSRILRNLVALIFGCLLALLVVEGILRLYNPFEARIRGDEIVLPVDKRYVFASHGLAGVDDPVVHSKNSLGFRGSEPPPAGLADYLSVIVIGGSTTECFYLSDGKTWADHLGRRLAGSFDRVWVNNAGLDGHSTFGHLVLVRDHIAALRPRVAVVLVGVNEIGRRDHHEHTLSHLQRRLSFDSLEAFGKSAAAHSEVASLSLNLYRGARARALGLPHTTIDLGSLPTIDPPEGRLQKVLARHQDLFLAGYERRLRELIALLRKHEILPVLVTQPALYGEGSDPLTGVDLAMVRVGQRSGLEAWRLLELYNDATRRVARRDGALLIDLATEMAKQSNFYYDFIHFNHLGAEEVARIVASFLIPHLEETFPRFSRHRASSDPS